MAMDEPVTQWLQQLGEGDQAAAERLWGFYRDRLYAVAQARLGPNARRVYDEEDLAQSAFHSLCRGVLAGRFPDLSDREGIERLLMTISARKIAMRQRYDLREKRDISRLVNDSELNSNDDSDATGSVLGLRHIANDDLTPDMEAAVSETCDQLFASLGEDESLQQVVLLKLEAFTADEIAERLGVTRRTVERKLERIRRKWQPFLEK
jgi:RNA polymerase sigma factor (sigma-70 family)